MDTITQKKGPGRPPDRSLPLRRQDEILDAAARLFAERGYPDATIEMLAETLGVGKGTIYRYFSSKQELFLSAVDRGMRHAHEAIMADVADIDDPLERIQRATRTYLTFFAEHPEFVELLIQERAFFRDRPKPTYFEHRDRHVGRWQALLAQLIDEGRVRRLPVEQIGDVLSDLLYGTMFTNYFTGRRRSTVEQTEDIFDVVLHGILSEAEQEKRRRSHGSQP